MWLEPLGVVRVEKKQVPKAQYSRRPLLSGPCRYRWAPEGKDLLNYCAYLTLVPALTWKVLVLFTEMGK